MCPLRFILVFFSALLAGYFAWRTARSSQEAVIDEDVVDSCASSEEKQEQSVKRRIQNGFWVFVDMASGRYLWRNLREMKNDEKAKNC